MDEVEDEDGHGDEDKEEQEVTRTGEEKEDQEKEEQEEENESWGVGTCTTRGKCAVLKACHNLTASYAADTKFPQPQSNSSNKSSTNQVRQAHSFREYHPKPFP